MACGSCNGPKKALGSVVKAIAPTAHVQGTVPKPPQAQTIAQKLEHKIMGVSIRGLGK